jgi:hypothetical protein
MKTATLTLNQVLTIPANTSPTISIAILSGSVQVSTTNPPLNNQFFTLNESLPAITLSMTTPDRRNRPLHIKATSAATVQWVAL